MTATTGSSSRAESMRTDDYGYSNARVRGMRARLLGSDRIERLLRADDLKSVLQELMHGEYTEDLEGALIHGRGAGEIDEGLKSNLVRTYAKVRGFLNTEAFDICNTLLARWDIFNLKTIVRGLNLHLSTSEISHAMLPVGALSQSDLEGILSARDVRDAVNLASTWGLPHAHVLREGLAAYQRSGAMVDMELPLDRHFAEWASARLAKRGSNYEMARWLLGMQIDILNLVIVFRAAREALEPDQSAACFLPGGGDLDLETYQRLAIMSDVDEILDALKGTRYGKVLDETVVHYLETNSLAVFERGLEDYFTRRVLTLGMRDPLGVGIPIAYLWAKQNEVTNLRIIVKGKSVGLPVNRMRKELILV